MQVEKVSRENGLRRFNDYVIVCNSLKVKISQMEVVEDFESRPHKSVPFVIERGKEMQEWNEHKLPKVPPGYSGGRLPGRSTKEKGRVEGEVDEGGEERRIWGQIVKEVAAGILEKVSMEDGVRNDVKRPVGQSFMRSWDCSQIENEEEEESWREGDKMAGQWHEEQKLEEILERKWMEGSPVQLEVMQNAPKILMHERMSQGIGVKGREKKKVSGWSMEEM